MAEAGPSPVIPFLLVATLAMFICRQDLSDGYDYASGVQDKTFLFLVILPMIAFFTMQSSTEKIVIPIAFCAVVFLLRTQLLGPIVILMLIHLLSKWYYTPEKKRSVFIWEEEEEAGRGDRKGGMGWFLLLVLGPYLYDWFYEGEGYPWLCFCCALAFVVYFNVM